jgi:hypothetical protein
MMETATWWLLFRFWRTDFYGAVRLALPNNTLGLAALASRPCLNLHCGRTFLSASMLRSNREAYPRMLQMMSANGNTHMSPWNDQLRCLYVYVSTL